MSILNNIVFIESLPKHAPNECLHKYGILDEIFDLDESTPYRIRFVDYYELNGILENSWLFDAENFILVREDETV